MNATAIGGLPRGLAFGRDGSLFLANQGFGVVVQIDPTNGTVLRTVANNLGNAVGLATDPLSGDLFVSNLVNNSILRISNFASGPGTASLYASPGNVPDGIAFGPDGTLYAALLATGGVAKITGTDSPMPGAVTILPVFVGADGMAISATPNTPFLYGNDNAGIIAKVDLSTTPPTVTDIFTGGSRGDFATVGLDGCLYATQTDRVIKVTNADGTCLPPPLGPLFPTNQSGVHVFVDIKPGGCPNPINVGAEGVLPVAILGTPTFDVTTIDPSSVRLEGVPALRSALEDVATPFTGPLVNATSCTTAGPDGFTDLVLFFDDSAVSAALGTVTNGQVLVLSLSGNLKPEFGGTPITGRDVIVIRE